MSAGAIQIVPRCAIDVRPATIADLPFMDKLQKANGKALGYFPTQQFTGYIEMGAALIAQDGSRPLGYVISRDRYLKRDELGVIYQLCISPEAQRKLVGAMLVRELFARSAYGCRLYCCWCAQDLEANYFWESMGFLPIAFRAGSSGKRRLHIFWQRRIVEADETAFWYPSQTNQGAIREDRLVFPIPPGMHWRDVKAVEVEGKKQLPVKNPKPEGAAPPPAGPITPPRKKAVFGAPPPDADERAVKVAIIVGDAKPKRQRKPKAKPDPEHVAAARELRDRYLERFNEGSVQANAKYEVARPLPAPTSHPSPATPLPLPDAA